jgi:hypothetical protein
LKKSLYIKKTTDSKIDEIKIKNAYSLFFTIIDFENLNLKFVSDFGFRISDFS